MYLTEYQKSSVENFMGLWSRGSLDDIPPDHASDCHNMAFARKREVLTRPGASIGRNVSSNVVRQFIACFDEGGPNGSGLIPLHTDGVGNVWRDDINVVLLHIPGMVDASFLNMNNHVYILPMITTFTSGDPNNIKLGIYVWEHYTITPRLAAGTAPGVNHIGGPTVDLGAGNTGPGYYGYSVSYVTSTGFVSAPASNSDGTWPVVYVPVHEPNGPGTGNVAEILINTSQIAANAPAGATDFIVWFTQGQQDITITQPNGTVTTQVGTGHGLAANAQLFQYQQYPIDTSNIIVNFFDTDLTVSANNLPGNGDVQDAMPMLPVGIGFASASLGKYHGRMIIVGTSLILEPDPNNPTVIGFSETLQDDRIWISNAGQPETFNKLTGYVNIQAEFDGNTCRTSFELFGVLYICKAVGVFAVQSSGSEPNDPTNPWVVNMVDGGIGAYHHSVGTISGSQPSLSFNSTAFLANRNGLFLFNGNVLRPELTWKIRAVWGRITHGAENQIRVAVDIFNDIFYVIYPADGQQLPSIMLMGDYSLGLDYQNIRWSTYNFPWEVNDIVMGYYGGDVTGSSFDNFLRMGSNGIIYKLDGATNTDTGLAIDNWYQCAPMTYDQGAVNIFRFIRYRMAGQGGLITTVTDQGDYVTQNETIVVSQPFPGNYKDIGLQINFTNEKAMVRFRMNGTTDYMRMARVDVFGKSRWPTRPNA